MQLPPQQQLKPGRNRFFLIDDMGSIDDAVAEQNDMAAFLTVFASKSSLRMPYRLIVISLPNRR